MKKIIILLKKDISTLIREPSRLLTGFIFILFSMILFYYAIISQNSITKELMGGLFWILFIFSLLILLSAIIEIDKKNDNFQGIIVSNLSPFEVYFERILLIFFTLILTSLIMLIFINFFFSVFLSIKENISIIFILIAISSISSIISIMINLQNNNQIVLYLLFVILNIPLVLIAIQFSISNHQNSRFLYLLSFGLFILYFFLGIIFSEILLKGTHE